MRSPNKRPDPTDNPLTNPYATFPEEEKTEEQIDAEAKERAGDIIHNYMCGKDRSEKALFEIRDAQCQQEVIEALMALIKVSESTNLTGMSKEYSGAVWNYANAFKTALASEQRFYVENE